MADNLWRIPDDVMWALKSAAEGSGFVPHATSTAKFAGLLETRGFMQRSETAPIWHITAAGQSVLMGETALTNDDLMVIETFQRAV